MIAGQLEIQMFANVARLAKDMNDAKRMVGSSMKSIEGAVSMAKTALGALGIGLGVSYFARFIKGIIDTQDELSKLSQKLNVPVEQLAGLRHAADLAGISNEALTKGFKSLSSQMFDASMGLAESKRNFGLLGIEVKNANGSLKDTQAVMLQVADRFAGMQDGATKSALAVKLFGKAGLDMIPLLNEGSAAIAAMIAEGQRLNPVTAESAKQAEIFNDNMERVGKTMKGGFIEAMNKAMPWIADISNAMAQAAKDAGFWTAALVGLGGAITHILGLSDMQKAKGRIEEIDKALSIARKQLEAGSLKPPGAGSSFFSFLIPDVKLTDSALVSIRKVISKLEAERARLVASGAEPDSPKNALASLRIPDDVSLKKAIDEVKKLADLQRQFADDADADIRKQLANEAQVKESQESAIDALAREVAGWSEMSTVQQTSWDILTGRYKDFDDQTKNELLRLAELIDLNKQRVDAEKAFADAEKIRMAEQREREDNLLDEMIKRNKEMDQYAKTAAKHIQSAFADFLFDPFKAGLGGMLDGFTTMLRRMAAEAAAADLARRLFGSLSEGGSGEGLLGGLITKGLSFLGLGGESGSGSGGTSFDMFKDLIPSYDVGTNYVPRTGLALVHQGEKITPASENTSKSVINISFAITGAVDRRTQSEIAASAGQAVRLAMARNR